MARSRIAVLGLTPLALALAGLGCSASPPPTHAATATHPADAPASRADAAPPQDEAEAPPNVKAKDEGLPPGVIRLARADRSDPGGGRLRVAPAPLDVASLPLFEVPEPLDAEGAPTALPESDGEPTLKIEKIDSGWRARGAEGSAVYVVLDAELGRLQIGAIAPDRNATDRVYRTCGDRYYQQTTLTPARWQTLTRDGDDTKLTVVDAWFDARSCKASVVRRTEIVPEPVLGFMLYAFRSSCDSCGAGERVTFVAPPLSQVAADGLGGEASVSHGSFSIVELPLRRGGAASFTGQVPAHALTTWAKALGVDEPDQADVVMGAELQHAVGDDRPMGIAYATLMTR